MPLPLAQNQAPSAPAAHKEYERGALKLDLGEEKVDVTTVPSAHDAEKDSLL